VVILPQVGGDTSTGGGTATGGDTSTGGNNDPGSTGSATGGASTAGTATGGDTAGTTTGGSNDENTMAVADSAVVDQGMSVLIDVLENDTDGAQQGLTLQSVSDTPNATIVIEGDEVRYSPDANFFGMESFLYTIVDGDGTEATGTVNVTVNRFSDINGDGINDFIQCNCTDLTLETGVHGSGVGGRLPASTLAIVLVALIGRCVLVRRRRYAMGGANA